MITLTFGKMFKKPNSTKQTMEDEEEVSVSLKENVDIKAPIFLVNFDTSNYNYIKWEQEDYPTRYYWIDNTVYVHNALFEVHCSMDLAATYKALFQYGCGGHCLYCSDETYWDEFFDDLRFNPSNLDTYRDLGFLDENYLYETSNVFGNKAELWDVTYDEDTGAITGYGNGTYVMQTQTKVGMKTYLLTQAQFTTLLTNMANIFWAGAQNLGKDLTKLIVTCNWMPIKTEDLAEEILGHSPTTEEVVIGNDSIAGAFAYPIPYFSLLTFNGEIDIPQDPEDHPKFMENARWNKLLLSAPGGTTELSLDMCYGAHKKVYFNTAFDVVATTINTKFSYDSEGGWSNINGSLAYESECNIGQDAMCLITKIFNAATAAAKIVVGGAALAGGAFLGGAAMGAAGAGAGLAKIKAAQTMKKNNITEWSIGGQNLTSKAAMQQGISETLNEGSGLGKTLVMGGVLSQLNPHINTATATGTSGNSQAALFNTQQLGLIQLRLKPLRCKELAQEGPGADAEHKYKQYCGQHGFPVNQNWLMIPTWVGSTPIYVVIENAQFYPWASGVKDNVLGITDEELAACQQLIGSGLWIE